MTLKANQISPKRPQAHPFSEDVCLLPVETDSRLVLLLLLLLLLLILRRLLLSPTSVLFSFLRLLSPVPLSFLLLCLFFLSLSVLSFSCTSHFLSPFLYPFSAHLFLFVSPFSMSPSLLSQFFPLPPLPPPPTLPPLNSPVSLGGGYQKGFGNATLAWLPNPFR